MNALRDVAYGTSMRRSRVWTRVAAVVWLLSGITFLGAIAYSAASAGFLLQFLGLVGTRSSLGSVMLTGVLFECLLLPVEVPGLVLFLGALRVFHFRARDTRGITRVSGSMASVFGATAAVITLTEPHEIWLSLALFALAGLHGAGWILGRLVRRDYERAFEAWRTRREEPA